jgi:hypothetical protein
MQRAVSIRDPVCLLLDLGSWCRPTGTTVLADINRIYTSDAVVVDREVVSDE